jgi:hypothetical protein
MKYLIRIILAIFLSTVTVVAAVRFKRQHDLEQRTILAASSVCLPRPLCAVICWDMVLYSRS